MDRRQSPTLKLGDTCLLVPWGLILLFSPEESATTTSSDRDVNTGPSLHLLVGPPHDITDDLNQGTLNWRSLNTWVERAAPQWRVRPFPGNKVIHHKDDRLQTEPLPFPSPSIFPLHPDAQSLHPETSVNLSLPSEPMFNPSHSPLGSTSLSTPGPTISPFPLLAP